VDSDKESLEFARLKHAMETVGFSSDTQHRYLTLYLQLLDDCINVDWFLLPCGVGHTADSQFACH